MAESAVRRSVVAEARHSAFVRVTHWLTALSFAALLVSGVEILISHPRFYWGETGNVNTPALFQLPIPSSRATVPTGYGYVLRDQNGWSRNLHFQSAWAAVLTGLVYVGLGFWAGHFRRHLMPDESAPRHWSLRPKAESAETYNLLQRIAYLTVIFVLFPVVIWTGLAMSPAIVSAFPGTIAVWGGQQSARTIHFFVSVALVGFVGIHLAMVSLAGFRSRVRAMITGRV